MISLWTVLYVTLIFKMFCEAILNPVTYNSSHLRAFSEVVDEFFVKTQIPFNVINIRDTSGYSNYSIDGVLAKIQEQNAIRLSNWNLHPNNYLYIKMSTIFLISTCFDYASIHFTSNLSNEYPRKLKFLMFVQNCDLDYLKFGL